MKDLSCLLYYLRNSERIGKSERGSARRPMDLRTIGAVWGHLRNYCYFPRRVGQLTPTLLQNLESI